MRADLGLIQNLLLGVRISILLLIVGLGVFGVFSSRGNYTTGIFAMAPITIIPIMIVNTIGVEERADFYVA